MNWGIPDVAMKTLESYGIELVMNEKVTQYSEATGVVTLASGKTLQCDYYVPPCLGSGNCKFLPAASQDGNGYAKVRFYAHFHDSPHPAHVPPSSHPHICALCVLATWPLALLHLLPLPRPGGRQVPGDRLPERVRHRRLLHHLPGEGT